MFAKKFDNEDNDLEDPFDEDFWFKVIHCSVKTSCTSVFFLTTFLLIYVI